MIPMSNISSKTIEFVDDLTLLMFGNRQKRSEVINKSEPQTYTQEEIDESLRKLDAAIAAEEAKKWKEWRGGECPVPADTRVDLEFANRYISYGVAAGFVDFGASAYTRPGWTHEEGSAHNIIAYRLAPQKQIGHYMK